MPSYAAVIEVVPLLSAEVVIDALPFTRVAVPSVFEPSKNTTVPVAELGETVAANVTGCLKAEGFALDTRATELLPFVTAAKFAVTECGEFIVMVCGFAEPVRSPLKPVKT